MNLTHLRMRTEKVSRRRHLLSHTKNNLNICVIRTVCFINISVRCSNFNSSKRKENNRQNKTCELITKRSRSSESAELSDELTLSRNAIQVKCCQCHLQGSASDAKLLTAVATHAKILDIGAAGVGMRLNK